MRTYIVLILAFLCSLGCKKRAESVDVDIKEIIVTMVDKKSFPLPVPPSINDTTAVVSKRAIDSLLQVKLKVAIYPIFSKISKSQNEKFYLSDDDELFALGKNDFHLQDLNGVQSKKGHQIILADTVQLKKSKDYKNFDLLFRFSNFSFSEDRQKAVFELGISRSHLAGSSAVYVLKKSEGEWIIEESVDKEIW
ncbi:hypothetical protein Q4Q34_09995 [Flavivirga abyssicola]|uniref:hypothetical protein n=1 Tax=Flavivirga abyssicola TaxID=3063533 RepID=UPI0026DECAFC|nr:hypothetical protein [Flavivirga sp. MEBiC07777]WVK11557.1 hypothetical protein Q4Q34_09995 [Flavivirga sp. MEBiC07777]